MDTTTVAVAAPGHPFGGAWATAWRRVKTERVLAYRGQIAGGLHVPLYLIADSPAWAAFEAEAGVADAWGGRKVVYGPSPYATYGLEAAGLASVSAAVAAGLDWAEDTGAAAAVFPGLRDPGPWAQLGGIAVRTTGSHVAPVHGSAEGFQAAITEAHTRREFGREHRRGVDAGLWLDVLPGWSMRSQLAEFTRLAAAASARHDTALYGKDIFRAVAKVPGSVLLCAMCPGERHAELAGGMLCLAHDRTLYLWAAGIDYTRRSELHTYRWLVWEAIAFAARLGWEFIDAGRGNYAFKARLGFSQIPLYAAVFPVRQEPALERHLIRMGEKIEAGAVT